MSVCTQCGRFPAVQASELCFGCLALHIAGDALDRTPSGSPLDYLRPFVTHLGPLASDLLNGYLHGRARPAAADGDQPASEAEAALSYLRALGFVHSGQVPTRAEVEAYRRAMARQYHPDLNPARSAELQEHMALINAACDQVVQALD